MSRVLAILGSAETTPTMIKPHRSLFEQAGDGPAVLLDTPYGFQENADDISARAIEYFAQSVGRTVSVARLRGNDDTLTAETARTRVREAVWAFAGPGSPSYAMRVWGEAGVSELLADKLRTGGVVVFSSAASLTLGIATVPVYEIYKAGADPHWLPGLDLMNVTGLKAAVIPHYDNAEGGHHDTRYCYLGERRLAVMERELPDDAFVLGIDEHTGVILDLDAGRATVVGLGGLTIRKDGHQRVIPSGSVLAIDDLRPDGGGSRQPSVAAAAAAASTPSVTAVRTPLLDEATRLDAVFTHALAAHDAPAAVTAVLQLEEVIQQWSGDNAATDEPDRARALFRSMLVRLGEVAVTGARDPREVIGPFVDIVMARRAAARVAKEWAVSDELRDALAAAGVEVRDAPTGATWHLQGS